MKIKLDDNNEIRFGLNNNDDINLDVGDTIDLGTNDYNDLTNKPSIEGVELIGDVSLDDLGVAYVDDIPTDVSELENDAGYISTESDPTVPAWAKAPTKPTYTASEVHALSDNTFIPSALGELDNDMGYITADDIPPLVTDLGYIDSSEYEDDKDAFLNTLIAEGDYRFIWEDGDDFETYIHVENLLDDSGNGFIYQRYWYTEEGPHYLYHRWMWAEDSEVLDYGDYSYMTFADASSSFAILGHGHLDSAALNKTVWDYIEDDLIFNNTSPLVIYNDQINNKNWIIERFTIYKNPLDRFVRVCEMDNPSHFYQRHGTYSGGSITWDSWQEFGSVDSSPRIFSGTSDTAAATTEKAVVCPEFKASDLKVGTMILVSFDNTNSGAVGSITLNVNGTGPKPIRRNNSGTIGNLDSAGYIKADSTYPFIYDGANWVTWYDTNTNTIGYTIRTNGLSLPMKSITYRYRIMFTSSDGNYYVPANNSTSTNATASRTVCQDKIDPFGRIVYYGTTASVAAGSRPNVSYQYQQYNGIALGYSFNRTGAALTLTAWKPVYVKCTPQADGGAIIDATTPYVQDLPTTNDGFIYIFLGIATAATTIEMTIEHPVYYHDGTRIRLWT